ncbi:MAG: response regulator [Treponema sp.]|jgi:CheY-like chemotaxis protein|nr:response regulator [Treponema sp.]
MKTIFVVDDCNVNLLMADDSLSGSYNVFTLACVSTMFELLDKVIPDLILLDIMMPDIDGFEALKRLKIDNRYTKIPVILLTGKNDAAIKALGDREGAADFISKPFSAQALLNSVSMHL